MRGSLDSSKNNMCNTLKTKKEVITSILLVISMAAWNGQLHENTRDKVFSTERQFWVSRKK